MFLKEKKLILLVIQFTYIMFSRNFKSIIINIMSSELLFTY